MFVVSYVFLTQIITLRANIFSINRSKNTPQKYQDTYILKLLYFFILKITALPHRNSTMAGNLDMGNVLETLVSSAPQSIGNFGAMMLPVSNDTQVHVSRAISYVAYTLLVDVFDVAASQGFQFNAVGLTLKQIQKQLEELTKKVDKLLKADMDAAKNRLYHAMNNLENEKTHHLAYDEFKQVLSLAEKAYPKVEEFKDKIFCKKIGIFSRVMTSLFDTKQQVFVALSSLSESEKRIIANGVFHEVHAALQDFESIEIPLSKSLFGKTKKQEQKNQDILDSVLRSSLPVTLSGCLLWIRWK